MISPFPTVDVDPNLEKESPEYLEALAQATEELEFCVNLCKSRVMMVTCFDISMPTPGAPEGRREVEVWGRKESRRGETRKWENKGWRDVSLGRRTTSDRDGTRVDLCMKTEEIYSASLPRTWEMKCEHKCFCLPGKAVAITYSRVNEQHLEVPFLLFLFWVIIFHMVQVSSAYLGKPWTYCF